MSQAKAEATENQHTLESRKQVEAGPDHGGRMAGAQFGGSQAVLRRAQAGAGVLRAADLLALQPVVGNRRVGGLVGQWDRQRLMRASANATETQDTKATSDALSHSMAEPMTAPTIQRDHIDSLGEHGRQEEQNRHIPKISATNITPRISRQLGGACHPTSRWPGNMEHSLIEDDYVTNINPGGGAAEYAIPQSGPNGGTGYADIVDLNRHKVYEIKTYLGAPSGVVEAARYVTMAQQHCPPPIPQNPWSIGEDYPAHTIPFSDTQELVVQQYPEFPGVVVYYKRRRRRVPEPEPYPVPVPSPEEQPEEERRRRPTTPQPVPIPQPAMQQIRDFLRRVVSAGQDAEEAARQFLRDHPDLVYVVAGAAITIFVATIAEDILTLGAGLIDDPATLAAAAALWRVAMQMRSMAR
jgi:hypothetical protein